ncbi:ATP synthase subunit a [Alphaproteobacteria bacterium]|nr:ATP synthase subunit a [Alphaproteobacteria bacterium]
MVDAMSSFEVKNIIPLSLCGFDISITNSSLFMFLVVLVVWGVFSIGTMRKGLVPGKAQAVVECAFSFIGSIIKTNVPKKCAEVFPYMIALFLFIVLGNVAGLFPFAFSFTSQLIVTLGIAMAVFLASIIVGFCNQGISFLSRFVPSGVPGYLAPFMIVIELMSFFFRPISLGIRLFANMVSGHIMIEVIASFAASMAGILAISYFAVVPVVVNVLLNAFKLIVCGLQAYVFVVLSCIYLSESFEKPAH